VPFIIRVPQGYRAVAEPADPGSLAPGTVKDDLVSFVDFGPTVLSLAGVTVPSHMQGRPFVGGQKAAAREYVFAARDRMDEAYDLVRAARDKRYKYVRNFMPYVSHSQNIDYMNQTPTTKEMRRLLAEGKLTGAEALFFEPTKPLEELYDTAADPHEVENLAGRPEYATVVARMSAALTDWMTRTGDVGLIPEPEVDVMMRPGGADDPGWRAKLDGTDLLARLRAVRDHDGRGTAATSDYIAALADPDAPVRYWAVVGLHVACRDAASVEAARPAVTDRLSDASACARIAAAQALCDWGDEAAGLPVLKAELVSPEKNVRLYAITALGRIGERARPAVAEIEAALNDSYGNVRKAAKHVLAALGDAPPAGPVTRTDCDRMLGDRRRGTLGATDYSVKETIRSYGGR
jgi:uncharacterized sulfatase